MSYIKYVPLLLLSVILMGTGCKKSGDGDSGSGNSVTINELQTPSLTVSTGTVVRVTCSANASGPLHYHWTMRGGSYPEAPRTSAVQSSFDHGMWAEWTLSKNKAYTITVLAYTQDGVGSGEAYTYYTYDMYGNSDKTYYFYKNSQGSTWDEKSITITGK